MLRGHPLEGYFFLLRLWCFLRVAVGESARVLRSLPDSLDVPNDPRLGVAGDLLDRISQLRLVRCEDLQLLVRRIVADLGLVEHCTGCCVLHRVHNLDVLGLCRDELRAGLREEVRDVLAERYLPAQSIPEGEGWEFLAVLANLGKLQFGKICRTLPNFRRLVLGCIEADFASKHLFCNIC